MKIWLNGHEVKETNRFIMCDKCIFKRKTDHRHALQCLAKMFHLVDRSCTRGYQYEDNV